MKGQGGRNTGRERERTERRRERGQRGDGGQPQLMTEAGVWAARREGSPVVGTCVNSRKKRERKAFDPLQRGRQKTSKQNSSLLHFPAISTEHSLGSRSAPPAPSGAAAHKGSDLSASPKRSTYWAWEHRFPRPPAPVWGLARWCGRNLSKPVLLTMGFPCKIRGGGGGGLRFVSLTLWVSHSELQLDNSPGGRSLISSKSCFQSQK